MRKILASEIHTSPFPCLLQLADPEQPHQAKKPQRAKESHRLQATHRICNQDWVLVVRFPALPSWNSLFELRLPKTELRRENLRKRNEIYLSHGLGFEESTRGCKPLGAECKRRGGAPGSPSLSLRASAGCNCLQGEEHDID